MKIKTYKYEKTEVDSFEIPLPTEPLYCFETGIRRAIRIIPIWTTWQIEQGKGSEVIFQWEVTCVYQSSECKIEKFTISESRVEEYYNSKTENRCKSIIYLLTNKWQNPRTKEDFEKDLQTAINEINK